MSLIIEDGTGLATAESYVSVADADAYHTNFGNTDWAGYSTEQKEIALRRATVYIDTNYMFAGEKYRLAQRLEWPRYNYAENESWPEVNIVQACCELALRAVEANLLSDTEDQVVLREVIGPLRTDYAYKNPELRFPVVDRLLQKFTFSGGSSVRIGLTG